MLHSGNAMNTALQTASQSPLVAQATSDQGMLELWLRKHRNPNTKSAYAGDARVFRAFVSKPLHQVTVDDLEDFADSLVGLADATQSRRLSAVKSLIAYACQVKYLQLDVGAPVQLPKIKDTLGERIMTEDAVQHLLWSADSRPGRNAKRNAALLRLLYGAGLRISEACGLRWRDMVARDDAGQCTAFGKGGKTRVILLPKSLWNRIYLLRGAGGPDEAVFRSRKGGALNRSQVHRIVKAAAKRAKLPVAISAHYLRHSHASHALDRGAPVHVVQTTLGHASLTTTTRYSHARPGDSSAKYLVA
jgi:site-specific recombinase XerD